MSKPRLLLVPSAVSHEWTIRPLLEEWADVAGFDAPGVEGEPLREGEVFGPEAAARRGIEELDRLDWDRVVVVADEFAIAAGIAIAEGRPERVDALAMGHGCLSLRSEGERPALSPGVLGACCQLARTDFRTYARHLTQLTGGGFDEEIVDEFVRRVPREHLAADLERAQADPLHFENSLHALNRPLLLAKHEGCLLWTDDGWEDAVAAFPDAETMSTVDKPTASPEFADALRSFTKRVAPAVSGAS